MKYRLTVEQFEPNPRYHEEMKVALQRQQWGGSREESWPQAERAIKVLTVEVTDVEFAAIKKAALESMR